ncbi:MAG: sodium:proton antiporter [Clostridia bacterium]|nr:sodium:proton antiporter [Clostridia bacterium]
MEHYGILSVVPPVLAILLAVRTKNVILSLICGLLFGATVLSGWNPFLGFYSILQDYVYVEIAKPWQAQSLTNLLIIGAFVSLISASGGTIAFAKKFSKIISSKRRAELSMWFGGIFVWFSDSANSLLVGPVFQSMGDKMKVSREKFAYILDATSSPICALIPIISWGVYIMGLINSELEALSITNMTSWDVFVRAVPFQFYSWLTLAMVGYIAYTQFDYGPMLDAQKRAEFGKVLRDGAVPLRNTEDITLPEGVEAKASTMILPLIALLCVMFFIFIKNGFPFEKLGGTTIRLGIASGFITGASICIFLSVRNGIMTLKAAQDNIFNGMKGMVYLMVVMIFAWSLGSVCKAMGTANYIVDVTNEFLNPAFLPVIVFIIAAAMSLATGSSWGPYAILMPIAIPMALTMDAPLYVTVAAVISGGLFGDHCSPLSDTTILASMGAACDHIDHFKTQFPYALTVAFVAAILFAIAGFTERAILTIPGLIGLGILVYALHKISMNNYKKQYTSKA